MAKYIKKRLIFVGWILLAILLATSVVVWSNKTSHHDNNSAKETEQSAQEPEEPQNKPTQSEEPVVQPPATFDKTAYSLTDPNSIWVIVNKKHPLPSNYAPELTSVGGGYMRPVAASNMTSLLTGARDAGVPMTILSSYRSYSNQNSTYNGWVARDGQAAADTYSARPGYSEHQTGLAADLGNGICNLEACFGNTEAAKWLASNAHKYGFIIRYPSGMDQITGYQYEPWHIRYVGSELASEMQRTGVQTLEQFFNVSGGNY